MKFKIMLTGTAIAAAGVIVTGCAKQPAPAATEEPQEAVIEQAEEIFTPQTAMQPPAGPITDPETIMAVVNGKEIKQADINAEMSKMFPNAGQVPPAQLAQMQAQMNGRILDTLIVKDLLTKEADAANVQVTDAEIDETIEKMTQSLPPGSTLADQLARIGMTEEEFRATLAEDLRISNLMKDQLGLDKEPTDEEIQAFYTENEKMFDRPETAQASHILIKTEPTDDDATKAEKKAKAEAIRAKLLEGADFAETATAESDCPSSRQGGDLGAFSRGQMVPEFEEAAFTQELGEIGPIVETQFGYHIVKVTDRKEAGKVPLDEAREIIIKRIQNEKGRTAVGDYIEEIKAKADIEYPNGKPAMPQAPMMQPPPSAR